jgi:hypothetical protein
MFGLLLTTLGCGNNSVDLDKAKTVAYDPVKDGEPQDIGPGGKGGKGKGKGAGAPLP